VTDDSTTNDTTTDDTTTDDPATDDPATDDSITVCAVCGARYLRTSLTACAACHAPFATELLAEGGEEVGFDLADWDDTQRADIAMVLVRAGIAHRWEDSELVVADDDADRVEDLVDAVDQPDALPEQADDDGDLAADVLSALYVSSDVLQHDAGSEAAALDLLEALDQAPEVPPYGIEGEAWGEILARAGAVADLLAAEADDEEVATAARALRELVRPLV
jgi:hypothetical protein